ncbi:uncharacterized protein LOC119390343 [Rhipicephalus sanguineus]|uniref:uncharacterized protein LOC119390343 n=1 Tax=Rhipicephalus sanguineus TaxID=34632 RepID=UPI0020C577CF|nr:uncharacterized protein LOC119390343 [Rhipicephalus sanguineus]
MQLSQTQNGASPILLANKVDRLEHELESTSELLRQANRELARREASLAQLGRHNERLRGRVARLESDVAVYRATSSAAAATSSSSSGEEDAAAADAAVDVSADPRATRCCSARDRELLRTLAGIYDKITRTGPRKSSYAAGDGDKCDAFGKNHRHAGRSLPDAHVLEQVFANFWQEYRSLSGELESCKQVVANQELRMRYLEAQVDAANRIKTSEFLDADVLKKAAHNGAVGGTRVFVSVKTVILC